MLAPIYKLLFQHFSEPLLELTEDQVAISYKTYKTDNADDMQAIIDGKLTPGIIIRKLCYL